MSSQMRRELLLVLGDLSDRFPDQRLGQLLANLSYSVRGPANESPWDATDDELLAAAKDLLQGRDAARSSAA